MLLGFQLFMALEACLSALAGWLPGWLAGCLSLGGGSNNQPNRTIYKPFPWHDTGRGCDAGKQQRTTNNEPNQTKEEKNENQDIPR